MSSKSKRIISSTPVRGSPLLRRSSIVSITPESAEVDLRQERLSNIRHSTTSSNETPRRLHENTNTLTNYIECFKSTVKLFQTNKITRQNVWNLNLIHDFYQLAGIGDKTVIEDLNLASVAIDASAKIYGMRVDDIHQDIVRLASGLMHTDAKPPENQNEENNENSHDEGVEETSPTELEQKKKKTRARKPKSHIISDLSQLNKDIDTIPELDKLFTCRTSISGEGLSSDKMYKLTLEFIENRVLTEISEYDEVSSFKITNQNSSKEEYTINTFLKCKNSPINNSLQTFKFLEWNPDCESIIKNTFIVDDLLNSSQQEIAFDVNAEIEKIPETDLAEDDAMDCDYNDDNLCFPNEDDDSDIPPVLMRNGLLNRKALKSIQNFRSTENRKSEYIFNPYIKKIINKLYAGPLHWKCPFLPKGNKAKALFTDGRSKTDAEHNKIAKQNSKKDRTFVSLTPSDKINEDMFKCKRLNKLKGPVILSWNEARNFLPFNLGLTNESIDRFFLIPAKPISAKKNADATCIDHMVPEYNYDNLNDSNFCAVVDNNELYSGGEDDMNTEKTDATESYVDAPDMVNKIKITYDTKARNVNMKLVKQQTWKIVQNHLKYGENEERSKGFLEFLQVYEELHQQLPASELTNLTQGIALLAVMHISNDNNLQLTQIDLSNFKIALPLEQH